MWIPFLSAVVVALSLAVAGRAYQKLQSLRQRLNRAENDINALQNALGIRPTRAAPMTIEGETKEILEFLVYQVAAIKQQMRLDSVTFTPVEREQTMGSFDYQWSNLTEGVHLPSDPTFLPQVKQQLCSITDLPETWFPGKKVADVGCGLGRFSYGLLSLGAQVTAMDQSANGLQRVQELCKPFADRLETKQINVLKEVIPGGPYDMVYSFGVLHHTGNTYQAILNVVPKVKPGGRLFLMLYGYPVRGADFTEQNNYDRLRRQLRNTPFKEKVDYLKSKFDPQLVHGWFDAVSPRINDILTFEEVEDFLLQLGFHNVKRTNDNANLHLVADKLP